MWDPSHSGISGNAAAADVLSNRAADTIFMGCVANRFILCWMRTEHMQGGEQLHVYK